MGFRPAFLRIESGLVRQISRRPRYESTCLSGKVAAHAALLRSVPQVRKGDVRLPRILPREQVPTRILRSGWRAVQSRTPPVAGVIAKLGKPVLNIGETGLFFCLHGSVNLSENPPVAEIQTFKNDIPRQRGSVFTQPSFGRLRRLFLPFEERFRCEQVRKQ